MFSLIPKKVTDAAYFASIPLQLDSVVAIKDELADFLKKEDINSAEITFSMNVTGEIMDNILKKLMAENKKNRFFDINVRIKNDRIIVILKDDGTRLDRDNEEEIISRLNQEMQKLQPGGEVSSRDSDDFSANYFYMNEQNTFTLTFGGSALRQTTS